MHSVIFFSTALLLLIKSSVGADRWSQDAITQIRWEFAASNLYLHYAHRLSVDGLHMGFADFYYDSFEEEREHGLKLLDFLNVRNIEASLGNIHFNVEIYQQWKKNKQYPESNPFDAVNLADMIRETAYLEEMVFEKLNNLASVASKDSAYAVVHFVEKVMLEEQTVAYKVSKDMQTRLERNSGREFVFLQMMDQELRKKHSNKA